MSYTNSPLVSYTKISPNKDVPRNHKIDTISIHCVVGQLSVESLGNIFAPTSRKASCNYGIGYDGRIGMYCEEKDRSWCTSSASNDNRAITIEVASDTKPPYKVNEKAYASLINLLVDICKRNDIKSLKWEADKSLIGKIDKQNMTVHRWFASKDCPGDYLYEKHEQIAKEVNERLFLAPLEESFYDDIEVGDILEFTGSKQYSSASATRGSAVKSSKVKVTQKHTENSKHPIHVRSIDDKGNFISGVYGWVDLADLTPIKIESYKVKVIADSLNYRGGPSIDYDVLGAIKDKGVYTIVNEENGWGQLGSKVGWINLKYTRKL